MTDAEGRPRRGRQGYDIEKHAQENRSNECQGGEERDVAGQRARTEEDCLRDMEAGGVKAERLPEIVATLPDPFTRYIWWLFRKFTQST